MIESEKQRTARNQFKKIWKRERFYNGYLASKDIDYSSMRVHQMETKQKARPFLKFLLTDSFNLRSPLSFGNQTSPILSEPFIGEPPSSQSQLEQGA